MVSLNISSMFKNTIDTQKIQDKVQRMKTIILVGYPSGLEHEGKDGEVTEAAELAKQLYYGTAEIPARPFLTDAIEKNKDEIAEALKKEAKREMDGGQANWAKVGSLAVGKIQEFVRGDYYRETIPNSPRTIEEKGSDKPLIDTSNLINATDYIVQGEND